MAVYVTGLVLVTAGVELVIAFFIAARNASVPPSSSNFWWIYFGVIVALVVAGAVLIPRGLRTLHALAPPTEAAGP